MLRLALGPSRRFSEVEWRTAGDVRDRESSGVLDLGVPGAEAADSVVRSSSSSSSPPKDNFPLASCFRFFFGRCGVDTLCFDHQSLPFANLVPCIKDITGSMTKLTRHSESRRRMSRREYWCCQSGQSFRPGLLVPFARAPQRDVCGSRIGAPSRRYGI